VARLTFSLRRKWNNHTGNQGVDPLRIYTPTTLEEVSEIVRRAGRDRCTVRAVGSGHSWSDVALTTGYLIRPQGMSKALDLDVSLLRPDIDMTRLVEVQAGMRVRELNAYLDAHGRALSNMGGYDGQTVAGVISTSTHGSGISYGPLSDFVRSLDVVAGDGSVHRIERGDGPTEPGAYRTRHPERTLVQDDHWFNAVVVGMGCMGVVYSVILEVEPSYWLKEVRTLSTWEQVKQDLRAGTVLHDNLHYEVYFNPYPGRDGHNRCLITARNRIEPSPDISPTRLRRNLVPEILSALPITPVVINLIMGLWPQATPGLVDRALEALADKDYTNVSYRVLNIGTANLLPAYSCEIGVAVDEEERHIQAVERIIEIARERRELGNVYQGSPISLRFVKASSAYMSMMHERTTMMIELIQPTHTEGGFELLAAYEDALSRLGGRPHWGQVNTLTGSHNLLSSMYPAYDRWQDVHRRLNASRVFDSPFSKRVGISTQAFRL
jgi:L-gulono-1,4-lactone dehydrogenase